MSAIDFDSEKSPFTPSGDLEDESNLNEILMESHGVDTEDDAAADEQNFASEELFDDESAKELDGEDEDEDEEADDDD